MLRWSSPRASTRCTSGPPARASAASAVLSGADSGTSSSSTSTRRPTRGVAGGEQLAAGGGAQRLAGGGLDRGGHVAGIAGGRGAVGVGVRSRWRAGRRSGGHWLVAGQARTASAMASADG